MAVPIESSVSYTRLGCAFAAFFLAIAESSLYKQYLPAAPSLSSHRRLAFICLIATQALLYLVDSIAFGIASLLKNELSATIPSCCEALSFLTVLLQVPALYDEKRHLNWIRALTWLLLAVPEFILVVDRKVTSQGRCVIQFPCVLGLSLTTLKGLLWLALGVLFLLQWLRDDFYRDGYNKVPNSKAAAESTIDAPNGEDGGDKKKEAYGEDDVLGLRRPAADELERVGGWVFIGRFRVFLPFIWPKGHFWMQLRFVACIVLVIAESFLEYRIPIQFANVVDLLNKGENNIWLSFFWLRFLILITSRAGLTLARDIWWMSVRQYRRDELIRTSFETIMRLSPFDQSVISSTDKISALDNAKPVTEIIDDVFFTMIPHMIKLCFSSYTIYQEFGSQMTLIKVCTVALLVIAQSMFLPFLGRKFDKSQTKASKVNRRRTDDIKGWATVMSHNRIDEEIKQYSQENQEHTDQYLEYTTFFYYLHAGNELVVQSFGSLIETLILYQIFNNHITTSGLIAFHGLWPFIHEPLRYLTSFFDDKLEALFKATQLRRIMELPVVEDKKRTEELKCPRGEIKFVGVSFGYPESPDQVLYDFNLNIRARQRVAIVGRSGSGKSTIVALLYGLRKLQEGNGAILIDGQDISNVKLESLCGGKLTVMDQNPYAFNCSVIENIRYARKNATDDEVRSACKLACIHDAIVKREKGYDTIIEEGGVNFSGGELQRMFLARILISKPKIVITDEATSALDMNIEQEIYENIRKALPDQTIVAITHRPAVASKFERIIVLGPCGKILDDGGFEELLAKKGPFWELWRLNQGLPAIPDKGENLGKSSDPKKGPNDGTDSDTKKGLATVVGLETPKDSVAVEGPEGS